LLRTALVFLECTFMGSWSPRAGEGLGRQGLGAARAWGGEGLGPWGSEGLARRGLGLRGLGAARAWGGEGLGGEGWKSGIISNETTIGAAYM
jgi:hypothetical protein